MEIDDVHRINSLCHTLEALGLPAMDLYDELNPFPYPEGDPRYEDDEFGFAPGEQAAMQPRFDQQAGVCREFDALRLELQSLVEFSLREICPSLPLLMGDRPWHEVNWWKRADAREELRRVVRAARAKLPATGEPVPTADVSSDDAAIQRLVNLAGRETLILSQIAQDKTKTVEERMMRMVALDRNLVAKKSPWWEEERRITWATQREELVCVFGGGLIAPGTELVVRLHETATVAARGTDYTLSPVPRRNGR